MNKDLEDSIKKITHDIRDIRYVDETRIPDIGLYMDQVIAFLDDHLSDSRRNDEDKIMTKTMINNYAKGGLIPAPEKKKYTAEHVMILILLYYYKNFLSISDIEKLLGPVIKGHYQKPDADIKFSDVFREIFASLDDSRPMLDGSVDQALEMASKVFNEAPEEDRDRLQLLLFTSILGQDIFAKLMIMQRLIDKLDDGSGKEVKEKEKKEKKDK